jgi:acyl-CoA synthetase (NDP forming)
VSGALSGGAAGRRTPREIVEAARRDGRSFLLEPEGYELLAGLGIPAPRAFVVPKGEPVPASRLDELPGSDVIVKIVSPTIVHKSDVGGVALVAKTPEAVVAAIRKMEERIPSAAILGYLVAEKIEHEASPGGELLVGMRWLPDFGPVVSVGFGGIASEKIALALRPEKRVANLSPSLRFAVESALDPILAVELASKEHRGKAPRVERAKLLELVGAFLDAAAELLPSGLVDELEVNPFVATPRGLVALDLLARLGPGERAPLPPPRPLDKVHRLLEPESVAILGVSEKGMNPGRIILGNLLRRGYDANRIFVVKPGREELDGARCVPDLASLPGPVDLLVVAIEAARVPALLEEVLASGRAESLIVIPGGLGERAGSEGAVEKLRGDLAASRKTPWRGPIVNGGNCLGVRSVPGRIDTMFIPVWKLPAGGRPAPVALLSQSGAFAVALGSRLDSLELRYSISIGNQLDLTVADYLEALADDPGTGLYACYVEGFLPGDGLRFAEQTRKVTEAGKTVLLYLAGRTAQGAAATASHTASISGDFAVGTSLARQAGAIVVDDLDDFQDLIRLFSSLAGKRIAGRGLAAMSNAGFECVAFADNIGSFEIAKLGEETLERITTLFRESRLDGIVEAHNPLDVTPILGDEGWEKALRALVDDAKVDAVVVGCVPLAGALQTLAAGEGHREDVASAGSVASRTIRVFESTGKPLVAVVNGGPLYDPMVRVLEEGGVPTFRSADRALRLLGIWAERWRRG